MLIQPPARNQVVIPVPNTVDILWILLFAFVFNGIPAFMFTIVAIHTSWTKTMWSLVGVACFSVFLPFSVTFSVALKYFLLSNYCPDAIDAIGLISLVSTTGMNVVGLVLGTMLLWIIYFVKRRQRT